MALQTHNTRPFAVCSELEKPTPDQTNLFGCQAHTGKPTPPHESASPDSTNSKVPYNTHSDDSSQNTDHTFAANNKDTNRALRSPTVSMGGANDAATTQLSLGAAQGATAGDDSTAHDGSTAGQASEVEGVQGKDQHLGVMANSTQGMGDDMDAAMRMDISGRLVATPGMDTAGANQSEQGLNMDANGPRNITNVVDTAEDMDIDVDALPDPTSFDTWSPTSEDISDLNAFLATNEVSTGPGIKAQTAVTATVAARVGSCPWDPTEDPAGAYSGIPGRAHSSTGGFASRAFDSDRDLSGLSELLSDPGSGAYDDCDATLGGKGEGGDGKDATSAKVILEGPEGIPSLERMYGVNLDSTGSNAGVFGDAEDPLSVCSSVGSCSPGDVVSVGATGSATAGVVSIRALNKPPPAGTVALGTSVGTSGEDGSVRKGTHNRRDVRSRRKGACSTRRKGVAKAYFTTGMGTVRMRTPKQLRGSLATSTRAGQRSVSTGEQGRVKAKAAGVVDSGLTGGVHSLLTGDVGSATAQAAHGLALLQFAARPSDSVDLFDTDSNELADTACSAYTGVCAACSAVLRPVGGPVAGVGLKGSFVGHADGMALPGASADAPGSKADVLSSGANGSDSDVLVPSGAGGVVGAETGAGLLAAGWRENYFDTNYKKPTASVMSDARFLGAEAGADVLGQAVSPYAMCMGPAGAAAAQATVARAGSSTELNAGAGAGTFSCTPLDLVSVLKPAAGVEYLVWNDLAGSSTAVGAGTAARPVLNAVFPPFPAVDSAAVGGSAQLPAAADVVCGFPVQHLLTNAVSAVLQDKIKLILREPGVLASLAGSFDSWDQHKVVEVVERVTVMVVADVKALASSWAQACEDFVNVLCQVVGEIVVDVFNRLDGSFTDGEACLDLEIDVAVVAAVDAAKAQAADAVSSTAG